MSRPIVVIAFIALTTAMGAGRQYPGSDSSLSPDGRWLVSYVPATGELSHQLVLADVHRFERNSVPLLGFNRSCDVLWSPDSRHLALTDWGGSNYAEIVIAEVGEKLASRDLDIAEIQKTMAAEEIGGHCYYEAVQWVDGDSLRVRVFGHADEMPLHSFDYWFLVSVRSGTAKLLKKQRL